MKSFCYTQVLLYMSVHVCVCVCAQPKASQASHASPLVRKELKCEWREANRGDFKKSLRSNGENRAEQTVSQTARRRGILELEKTGQGQWQEGCGDRGGHLSR